MEEKKTFWNNAFLVLFIPAICFVYAYCLESGYVAYYKIPDSLIIISNNSMLNMLLPSAIFFSLVYSIDSIISSMKYKLLKDVEENYIKTRMTKNFFLLFYTSILVFLCLALFPQYIFLSIIFGLLLVVYIIRYFSQRTELNKKKKGIIPWEMERKYVTDGTVMHIENAFGRTVILVIQFAFLTCGIVYGIGNYIAKNQTQFTVINNDKTKICLRKIGSNYITIFSNDFLSSNYKHYNIVNETNVASIETIYKDEIKWADQIKHMNQ